MRAPPGMQDLRAAVSGPIAKPGHTNRLVTFQTISGSLVRVLIAPPITPTRTEIFPTPGNLRASRRLFAQGPSLWKAGTVSDGPFPPLCLWAKNYFSWEMRDWFDRERFDSTWRIEARIVIE